MALFVHFAPENRLGSIRRSGLRPGRHSSGVYAVPATPDFFASHQWLRELKRFQVGPLSAVYFRLEGDAEVIFGPYGGPHRTGTADEAVGALMAAEAKLGFEALVSGVVPVSAITKIKPMRQITGWRYFPNAKGRVPCGCPGCMSRGEPFGQRIREKYGYD